MNPILFRIDGPLRLGAGGGASVDNGWLQEVERRCDNAVQLQSNWCELVVSAENVDLMARSFRRREPKLSASDDEGHQTVSVSKGLCKVHLPVSD